jgi:hypothetical protein
MLNAQTLSDAAKVLRADAQAYPNRESNRIAVLASDLEAEAQAGGGYGSAATLHLAIVIDNDRDLAKRRREIIAAHAPDLSAIDIPHTNDWPAVIRREIEEAYNLASSYAADALREWVEEIAGMEGLYFGSGSDSPARLRGLTIGLPDVSLALLRSAIVAVDWVGLARHYMGEDHRPRFMPRGSDSTGWDVWDTFAAEPFSVDYLNYDYREDAQSAADRLSIDAAKSAKAKADARA